ncbi:acyltransferase [Colwellia sp. E2M01]|uniref:acyltransferase n=1 Tax=Colwellia sp. E2M01 TaxID=2841561 RepID=UPI001C080C9C|nr:acyltransferase [Colwellia sp. E2M01]MBU2869087.1 acyltransferase [Colwellia sp. E2M01]
MKALIKTTLFTIVAIVMLPITLLYFILNAIVDSDTLLSGFSQLLSLIPGKFGAYLRAGFYRFTLTECAPNAVISFLVLFSQRDTQIASGVYIGPQSNIGKCKIGADTLIGSGVHIMSGKGQHNFDDLSKPIKDQGGKFTKVTIGRGSWVGNAALVMANVGNHCVVAAGAVVINDVEDYSVVAGNPAKVIKKLNE